MATITIDMPPVSGCAAKQCTYNTNGACHAKAITIGDQINPDCDTFFTAGSHVHSERIMAGVGACKVSGCKHNRDFECTAANIRVGFAGARVQCLSYEKRAG